MSGAMAMPQMGAAQRPAVPMQPPPQMPQGMPPGAPQGAPQGMPPQQPFPLPQMPPAPGVAPVGGLAARNPNLALFARSAQMPPPGGAQQAGGSPRLTPAEMGRLGRFGDQVVAHLTPGEIAVPPELQTPKVLATLNHAFHKAGVQPQQFEAGSPQSSHNPATGAPEYSLWAALLPVAGAVLGSFIPGIGTAAGAALGGAAGGAAGGLIDHQTPLATALGAAGGAAGGYFGAGGLSDLLGEGAAGAAGAATTGAGAEAAGTAVTHAPFTGSEAIATRLASGDGPGGAASLIGQGAAQTASPTTLGSLVRQVPWKGAFGAGLGAGLASSFAPPASTSPTLPPGFTTPMPPVNPNYGAILGSGQANRPSFANYNPYAAVSGQPYRFY